ncbi:MAG: alanine--tRNA ligase, partial [Alphaproteobacteria bacterium]|nr:alanine--tRNA ligase [Alphaproteobacteria bacterium]
DIGLVKVIAESGSSAGVRRMEALAGDAARAYLLQQDNRVQAAATVLKVAPHDVVARIETLLDERRKMERELTEARKALAMGGGSTKAGDDVAMINGTKFIGRVLKGVAPQDLKALADEGKKSLGSGVVALVAVSDDGKGAVVVAVTADLTAKFNAVELVKAGSIAMGGKGGGGRPDMAQAGGPDGAQAEAALAAVKAALG